MGGFTRLKSFPNIPAALGDDEIGHSQMVSELAQWQKMKLASTQYGERTKLWWFGVSVGE